MPQRARPRQDANKDGAGGLARSPSIGSELRLRRCFLNEADTYRIYECASVTNAVAASRTLPEQDRGPASGDYLTGAAVGARVMIIAISEIQHFLGERFELHRLSHVLGIVATAIAATAMCGPIGSLAKGRRAMSEARQR